jgi:hypothetical protein
MAFGKASGKFSQDTDEVRRTRKPQDFSLALQAATSPYQPARARIYLDPFLHTWPGGTNRAQALDRRQFLKLTQEPSNQWGSSFAPTVALSDQVLHRRVILGSQGFVQSHFGRLKENLGYKRHRAAYIHAPSTLSAHI